MSSKSILQRFSASAFCVLLSRVLAFVAVFGFNAVLARSLEPADFGLFALLFSLATLTSLLASCGMNRALVKILAGEMLPDKSSVRKVVNLGVATAVIAGLAVGSIAFFSCTQFLPSSSDTPFVIAALFGGIVFVRNVHFVLAETTRGFHETNWSNLFGGPAGGPIPHLIFLLALVGVWFSYGSTALSTVLAIYLACFAVTLPSLVWKLYSLDFDSSYWEKIQTTGEKTDKENFSLQAIWMLAIPLMLTQSFGLTLSQADIWLAGAMVLPASIAIYCAAQRMLGFLTIPLQISGTAIISFIPELVAKKQTKQLQEMVGLATFASGIPGLLIGIALIAFPTTILTFVFGEFYAQAATILQILVIGQMICVLTGPCEILLMMAGHQNKTLIVNIIAAVAIFTLGPIGILTGGITGLALAMCSVTIFQNTFNWWLARRLVGVSTHFNLSYAPQLVSQVRQRVLARKGQFNVTA